MGEIRCCMKKKWIFSFFTGTKGPGGETRIRKQQRNTNCQNQRGDGRRGAGEKVLVCSARICGKWRCANFFYIKICILFPGPRWTLGWSTWSSAPTRPTSTCLATARKITSGVLEWKSSSFSTNALLKKIKYTLYYILVCICWQMLFLFEATLPCVWENTCIFGCGLVA